jgi:hypothetical protein
VDKDGGGGTGKLVGEERELVGLAVAVGVVANVDGSCPRIPA